jgi:hypothetical protein
VDTFRVEIRVNVRPEAGPAFVEHVSPVARELGLRVRNEAPGLIEGDGIALQQLGALLMKLGQLPAEFAASSELAEAGVFDDVWVHVTRETGSGRPPESSRSR